MKRLILIRHGESQWNKLNLFTGWTNVDLSEKGIQEAIEAGKVLKENGYKTRDLLHLLFKKSHQDFELRA
jgi:Phosphoglycerate mutase 1